MRALLVQPVKFGDVARPTSVPCQCPARIALTKKMCKTVMRLILKFRRILGHCFTVVPLLPCMLG